MVFIREVQNLKEELNTKLKNSSYGANRIKEYRIYAAKVYAKGNID